MALSDLFNKAKNIINTAAEGANKIKDVIQQAASQKNEERPNAAQAESGSAAAFQTGFASRAVATPSEAARETETSSTDTAPEITPAAFKEFLIAEGYKEFTDAGKPSTVYMYLDAVNDVCKTEKMDLPKLATKIASIVKKYDKGGEKEKAGAKSHDTVINALKAFKDFVKKNKPKVAKEAKAVKSEKPAKKVAGENWEWAIEPQFDDTRNFHEGLASVKKDDKWGYINKEGKIIINIQFNIARSFSENLAYISLFSKKGYIDKTGRFIIDLTNYDRDVTNDGWLFDHVYAFSEGLASIKQNGKWGYINKTGKLIIKPNYEDTTFNHYIFKDKVSFVKINGKFGVIDFKGELIISPQFDSIYPFSEGFGAVRQDGKWGYIRLKK